MQKTTNTAHEEKERTNELDQHFNFKSTMPLSFILLCKLMDVAPNTLLSDFMDNLSCSSRNRENRDQAKGKLIDYFVEHGYGQDHYSTEDIRLIFREMDAVGLLFPTEGDDEMIDIYTEWREQHYQYWFNRWFYKPRRRT